METRKVQLSGGTTYTISLPKPWAREYGIDSDSLVAIHPNGDASLLVEVVDDGERTNRTTTVDVGTTDVSALGQQVIALYVVGFDGITLSDRTGITDGQQRAVEEAIGGLSGFELLEVTDTRMRVKSLVDAENVDIRKSALRLRLVALSMLDDALSAIADRDRELAYDVVRRDGEADKLFVMVTRHFRRSLENLHEVEKLNNSRSELFEYYYACRQFERVADHAEKMAAFVDQEEHPIPDALVPSLEEFGDTARGVLDDAADVVLTDADVEMAHDALARRDALCRDIEAADRELYDYGEPDVAYTTGLLLDSIERIANYGANVAEIGVQQVLRMNATSY
jgi:phosphate uptake regulator